jgi:predicted nucleic acid-binding protein
MMPVGAQHEETHMKERSPASPAVILDTNVFVAAGFNPRSASAKIVEAVKRGELRMVWNDATRREIEHIVQRIPPLRAHSVSDLFRPRDRYTAATHPERFAFIPDPDDRKFAALADATGATLISNDDHLLGYRDRMDLTVLTPSAFWKRWQTSRGEKSHSKVPKSKERG